MTLYLMRHAEAEPISTGVVARDAARPLTEKGCRQAERMGLLLKKLDVKIDRTLSSPFVRARKTAELVLAALHCASHEGRKQCFRMEWMISPAMTKRFASRHGSD
ncbi:MAG: SixA phosphatase family protein [Kiritimatiellia bacterium]